MNIVLWAYHEAGYRALRKLHAEGHVLLVFTENAPAHIPSIAELASSLGTAVYVGAADDLMKEKIRLFHPDLGLSMYYPRVLSPEIIHIPDMGSFNFHPSLLPRHRGCFSAPWAILAGDKKTGVTCHEMVAKIDSGRILCSSHVEIYDADTAFSLYYKLVDSAVSLLEEAIVLISRSSVKLTVQEPGGCYHGREVPFNGIVDADWSIDKIDRFIRAMYFPPWQPAQMILKDRNYPVKSLDEYMALIESQG